MPGWTPRFAALISFLALLVISSAWEMRTLRHDGELRLQQDATSLARRVSRQCAAISWEKDAPAARSAIFTEMEDLRLAAMLIHDREGLLEGMRRNGLWEPVPWDDLTPDNSVEASAPIMMEDVPVGTVIVHLSRRALDEEFSARARRELLRLCLLAAFPCLALALLVRQRAARVVRCPDAEHGLREQEAVLTPPDLDNEDARRAYLNACRAFRRDQHAGAAQLCRLAAREDWGELRAAARSLHEAARALNARPLAVAALAVQEAALAHTAAAARCVEQCIPVLNRTCHALDDLLRGSAADKESPPGERV